MQSAKSNKKVLFIVNHRKGRSPGQRFRFEQYIPFLEYHGYECHFSILLNQKDDATFYSKGNYFGKAIIFLKCLMTRTRNWMKMNEYEVIFVFREALMTGSAFFEKKFAKSKAKVIFDFDDAIWLQTVSESNKKLAFLKNASKTEEIIRLSDLVFAGNDFLARYARRFNENVVIVPTTIDTEVYPFQVKEPNEKICIGWSGSFSTIEHFETALPALKRIKEQYGDKVYFKIIGDGNYYCQELQTQGFPWKADTEVIDLSEIDIGIMPLPDTEWAKGKCGLKGLQYMALGIATIMSPIGVNTEIIEPGVNGYLPKTEDEWVQEISILIDDSALRKKIGVAGRATVEEKFSVQAWREKYLDYFNYLTHKN
jgi:glycosyltransferase involved in cell wall biosynthesis